MISNYENITWRRIIITTIVSTILLTSYCKFARAQLGDEFLQIAMHDRCNEDDPNCGLIPECCCKPSHNFDFKLSLANYSSYESTAVEVLCVDAVSLPSSLPKGTETLKILESNVSDLSPISFGSSLLLNLTTIYFWKNKELKVIRNETFCGFPALRTILLEDFPALTTIEPRAFCNLPNLHELKFKNSGITSFPSFEGLSSSLAPLKLIIDGTQIREILPGSCRSFPPRIKIVQISWNTHLSTVDDYAFNGSSIEQLILSDNKNFTKLSPRAFFGLNRLLKLSLRGTPISSLPTEDLGSLVEIDVRHVPSLHRFPAAQELPALRVAELTYSYHCCSLSAYGFGNIFEQNVNQQNKRLVHCNSNDSYELSTLPSHTSDVNEYSDDYFSQVYSGVDWDNISIPVYIHPIPDDGYFLSEYNERDDHDADDGRSSFISKLYGGSETFESSSHYIADVEGWREVGPVVSTDSTKIADTTELCYIDENGNKIRAVYSTPVSCTPKPDAFNPCENVLGSTVLPVVSWMVSALAIFGNFFVILVLSVVTCNRACARQHQHHLSVQKFLVLNLAVADMCMGFYLLMISAMDARSSGEYYKYGVEWQTGLGCKISGFLSIFSSQLSVYTLSVISLERWYAIRFAIQLEKRMTMGCARICIFFGWLLAGVLAMLPLVGVNNYEKTSICLPFDVSKTSGMAYVGVLLFIAIGAFVVDVICYLWMYANVKTVGITEGRKRRGSVSSSKTGAYHGTTATADAVIAKRMAILVFTNFVCFFPISFFAMTAAIGHPLISISQSKILLVIFYPINSCCNPFLYAILTKSFRRDLLAWFTSRGHCVQFAAKLNGAYWRRNSMDPGSMERRESGVRRKLQRCVKYVSKKKATHLDGAVEASGSYRQRDRGGIKGMTFRLINYSSRNRRSRLRSAEQRTQDLDNRSSSISSYNSASNAQRRRKTVTEFFKLAFVTKKVGERTEESPAISKQDRRIFPDVRWFKSSRISSPASSNDAVVYGRTAREDSSPLMEALDSRNEVEFNTHAHDLKHITSYQQGRRASKSRHSTTTIETRLTVNGNPRGPDEHDHMSHDPCSSIP